MNDDTSSQSSFDCSNLNYCSGNEDDGEISGGERLCFIKAHKSTRFCHADSLSAKQSRQSNWQLDSWEGSSSKPQRKLSRISSFVDVRSQLLHRSLLEEIHKRRMFKTVGAVENIGFQEPGFPDDDDKQRFKW